MTANDQETLPDAQPALRVVPMPADANQHGDIFGGWVMSPCWFASAGMGTTRSAGCASGSVS